VANLIRRGKQPSPLLTRANASLVHVFNVKDTDTADWVSRTLGDTTESYETGSQGETQQRNRFGAGSSSTGTAAPPGTPRPPHP
jgi:type IV secretory pathway TraG/TraD family ATPase VirD4